jgi:DNA-binding transcriptional LysR family regulator
MRKEEVRLMNRFEQFLVEQCAPVLAGIKPGSMFPYRPGEGEALPELLRHCREQMPLLQLKLRELETAEQLELLAREKLDIGFIRRGGSDFSDFNSKLLFRENYLLAMPENHPLATKNTLYCRDLSDQDLILFSREVNPEIFDRIVSALTPDSLPPPRFLQYARNKSSMQVLVQAGFGAALMPESCCKEGVDNLAVKNPAMLLPTVDITAVWRKEKNSGSTLKKFIQLLPEFDF